MGFRCSNPLPIMDSGVPIPSQSCDSGVSNLPSQSWDSGVPIPSQSWIQVFQSLPYHVIPVFQSPPWTQVYTIKP
ncbi:unnamed protein product [Staurois parvus]|uniref:Uncharacterized protein n=1 Tax=Staurois parvus TaxID=386267 RepID=A0ABN9FXQ8_9NEOB|nr:unnamed protein product [Staurois parvus]